MKVKTYSEVAGKATVFVFPDLNTGMGYKVWDLSVVIMRVTMEWDVELLAAYFHVCRQQYI